MKRYGIALSALVLIGGLVGMWAASRLTLVRNSWLQKTAKARAEVLVKRKQAADLEKQVTAAKSELQRATHGWERYWPGVPVEQGRQPGMLSLPLLGSTQGLVQTSVVYVFQPSADGAGTTYIGPFKASAVEQAKSVLTPFWRLRVGDDAAWRYGQNWRIRTSIPRQHKTKFIDLESMLLRKDEFLVSQQKHLAIQQAAKKSAEEHLQKRLKELHGGSELPKDVKPESLDRFLVEGYHKAVAETEVARDEVQAAVDELRRLLKRTRDKINQLTIDNERLAKQLGDPPKTALKP